MSLRFIGWFVDVTPHVRADQQQTLRLQLPDYSFLSSPQRVDESTVIARATATLWEAESRCHAMVGCAGFTFNASACHGHCEDFYCRRKLPQPFGMPMRAHPPIQLDVSFLNATSRGQPDHSSCLMTAERPPQPVGVFFENVETLYTTRWVATASRLAIKLDDVAAAPPR